MKKIITTALLIAITASGAMAGTTYKPGHSHGGYQETYNKMKGMILACAPVSWVPVGGALECSTIIGTSMNEDLFKTHMTKHWRDKVRNASIATGTLSMIPFGPQGGSAAIVKCLADGMHDLEANEGITPWVKF